MLSAGDQFTASGLPLRKKSINLKVEKQIFFCGNERQVICFNDTRRTCYRSINHCAEIGIMYIDAAGCVTGGGLAIGRGES